MSKGLKKSDALRILERDQQSGFGKDYIPCNQVSRMESPKSSSPSLVACPQLGRNIHTQSNAETSTLVYALCAPNLADLHEQKMMQIQTAQHPLALHPTMVGQKLPNVPGTWSVCKDLGISHPIANDDISPIGEPRKPIPRPYVSDFLLILKTEGGLRAVNWMLKGNQSQFGMGDEYSHPANLKEKKSKDKSRNRTTMEIMYYQAAGIPTQQISGDQFDRVTTKNLTVLMYSKSDSIPLDAADKLLFIEHLKWSINNRQIVSDTTLFLARRFGWTYDEAQSHINCAIWNHDALIDLRVRLLPDRPFTPPPRHGSILDIINKLIAPLP